MDDRTVEGKARAQEILDTYETAQGGLYIIGTFDVGVTVYSQQVRALNLAWSLIESGNLETKVLQGRRARVAIVGGGFAGLTLAAALIKKSVRADLTLFERRDTLLPLQQGSDSRWVHPRIYDWPANGSETASAELPVLNWIAGRASDVAVQILREWKKLLETVGPKSRNPSVSDIQKSQTGLTVYCNTNHLQIHGAVKPRDRLQIEWVGENRFNSAQFNKNNYAPISSGTSREFDIVILAVGFGLERDQAHSYWRNETLSQASLSQGRSTYIISGQGDGAMIDLLRVRISEFRQDRILAELFEDETAVITLLRGIQQDSLTSSNPDFSIFAKLEEIYDSKFDRIKDVLTRRLRRDTQVILHTKVKRISELFDDKNIKISFQNRLLVYLLYKCGGFIPSSAELDYLQLEYSVDSKNIIRRHGTLRNELLKEMLDESFFLKLQDSKKARPNTLIQTAIPKWRGGYFAERSTAHLTPLQAQQVKAQWRKEYLPPSTELIASAFCAAVAGYLGAGDQPMKELRVTIHRVLMIGDREVMQQACQYCGTASPDRTANTAGRTFPPTHATIGLSYSNRKIVSTSDSAKKVDLKKTMRMLKLNVASREM